MTPDERVRRRERVALRAARSASVSGAADVAAAAGVSVGRLLGGLSDTEPRGRCDAAASQMVMAGPAARGEKVLADRACPPPARRVLRHWVPSPRTVDTKHAAKIATRQMLSRSAATFDGPSRDHGWRVRAAVAVHPSCPAAFRWRFAEDEVGVRESLVMSERCGTGILCVLASQPKDAVWERLARQRLLPAQTLASLVHSDELADRRCAAEQPRCNPIWLRRLAADGHGLPYDRQSAHLAAVAHPRCPADVIEAMSAARFVDTRTAVARNPSTPAHIVANMATDSWPHVREAVALRPGSPSGLLEALAGDGASMVRTAVARNPVCPAEILKGLCSDEDGCVRATAAKTLKGQPPRAAL